jgi:hypothetical protein
LFSYNIYAIAGKKLFFVRGLIIIIPLLLINAFRIEIISCNNDKSHNYWDGERHSGLPYKLLRGSSHGPYALCDGSIAREKEIKIGRLRNMCFPAFWGKILRDLVVKIGIIVPVKDQSTTVQETFARQANNSDFRFRCSAKNWGGGYSRLAPSSALPHVWMYGLATQFSRCFWRPLPGEVKSKQLTN